MAATIVTTTFPLKKGSPPDFGTLYSGRALEFDGVSDNLNYNYSIVAGTDFTISAWVNISALGDHRAIWGQNGHGSAVGWTFNVYDDGRPTLTYRDVGYSSYNFHADAGNEITIGKWAFLSLTVDHGTSFKLYKNGKLVGTRTTAPTLHVSGSSSDGETCGYGTSAGTADLMNGKLANVQVWDSVLTEAEVQYSYTHPEKFAYNTSGSSLTASNLVAWYPMIEGEGGSSVQKPLRSPQMYIHDGSAKELGSEMLTSAGDIVRATGALDNVLSNVTATSFDSAYASTANRVAVNLTTVVGKYYKVSYSVTSTVDSMVLSVKSTHGATGSVVFQSDSFSTPATNTHYFTATTTTSSLMFDESNQSYSVNSISVKEVKMGNHGATTFLGDELIKHDEANNRSFGTDEGDWDNLGTSDSVEFDSNKLKVTITDSSDPEGAKLPITKISTDGSTTSIVAGRTYRVTANIDYISGHATSTPPMSIQLGNATSGNFNIDSDDDSYSVDLVPVNNTDPLTIRTTEDDSFIFTIDNVSVKEVGIAEGWSSVDSEPLIPQTALMGLSKKHAFDGVNDHVVIADNNAFSFGDGSGDSSMSISAWILPYNAESFPIVSKGVYNGSGTGTGEWRLSLDSNRKLYFYLYDDDADAYAAVYYNTALTSGKFYHIVGTYSGNESVNGLKLYVNGELVTEVDSTGGSYAAMSNLSGAVHIGRYDTVYAHGIIDEVVIWDENLGSEDVKELFNDGVPLDALTHSSHIDGSGGVVGYWKNNNFTSAGTWDDLSDTNVNGTMTGFVQSDSMLLPQGTTAGKDILGFPLTHTNNGWLQTNDGNMVQMEDNDSLDFGTGSFSVELWTKSDEASISNGYLVHKYSTNGWAVWADNTNQFRVRLNSAEGSEIHPTVGSSGVNDVGVWHHWVVIVDRGSQTCKIYKDSVRQTVTNSDISTITNVNTTAKLSIGKSGAGGSAFNGTIDEVRIYNRVLTAYEADGSEPEAGEADVSGEILKNYNHGKSKHS